MSDVVESLRKSFNIDRIVGNTLRYTKTLTNDCIISIL